MVEKGEWEKKEKRKKSMGEKQKRLKEVKRLGEGVGGDLESSADEPY